MHVANRRGSKWVALVVYALIAAAGPPVLALAINAASDQSRWPGPLDLIRVHPWWTGLLLVSVLAARIFVRERSGQKSDGNQDSFPPPGGRNLIIGQHEGNHRITQGDNNVYLYYGPESPAVTPSQQRHHLKVLYTAVPPLLPSWEKLVYDAVEKVETDWRLHVGCDPAYGRADQFEQVDAYVILYNANNGPDVFPDIKAATRQCRESSPGARILVVGCGGEEGSTKDAALCDMVRAWGLAGSWQASVFESPEQLKTWLSEHLGLAVSSARRRGRGGETAELNSAFDRTDTAE